MTHNPDATNTVDTTPFVLTRTVNAPRDLVWRAFTERECLAQWLSPTGMSVLPEGRLELRPGGLYHYGLRAANGFELWAKWTFREVTAPSGFVQDFAHDNLALPFRIDFGVVKEVHPAIVSPVHQRLRSAIFNLFAKREP